MVLIPGATDTCRTARGKDEETAPTSTSSAKGFSLSSECLLTPEIFCTKIMFYFQEITVVAGDGKPVKIHLGGENELEDCRRQVANIE